MLSAEENRQYWLMCSDYSDELEDKLDVLHVSKWPDWDRQKYPNYEDMPYSTEEERLEYNFIRGED